MSLAAPSDEPLFPPLLRGEEARRGQDTVAQAVARAALGADPGLIVWQAEGGRLAAAVVLVPELPLARAMGAVLAVALGFGDALGALAPPEVAVHHVWPGGFRVNGARCGRLRAVASTLDPEAEPDWLVVGIEVALLPEGSAEPGETPDATSLIEEGCGEIGAVELLEAWSRHMLVWLNRFTDDGIAPVHAHWRARAWKLGEEIAPGQVFVGIDELGGQLVRTAAGTELRPLTALLEDGP